MKSRVPGSSREPATHSPVNVSGGESPGFQVLQKVVQSVLELGEDEETLLRVVEEALLRAGGCH